MAKFKAKPFKDWLDSLARVLVKERDEWTCQYEDCPKTCRGVDWHHIRYRTLNHLRWDLLNGISLCSSCHREWHQGAKMQVWFEKKYPARFKHIYSKPRIEGTWKEQDFLDMQEYLIQKCIDFNIDPYKIGNKAHRNRLIKLIGE
jgi:hypothetical protein